MKTRPVDDPKAVGRKQLYLCIGFDPPRTGLLWDGRLEELTERHRITLELPPWCQAADVLERVEASAAAGVILVLQHGWLGLTMMRLCRRVLASGRRVYLYWPAEQAIECLDEERLASYRRHWAVMQFHRRWRQVGAKWHAGRGRLRRWLGLPESHQPLAAHADTLTELGRLIRDAEPVEFPWLHGLPSPGNPIPGNGIYLRTDFWAPIHSGGSYGHTCYVAKSLARVTENLYCLTPYRYRLLDEFGLGIKQLVLDAPGPSCTEDDIARATVHYYKSLKPLLQVLRPAYLYERLCLGNYSAARLSRELGIPYIVEYNGSEIAMRRSFDGRGYELEELYLQAELAAFRQATLISVVSEPIKEDLVQRGVDPDRILVNPNAADPDDYRPPTAKERARLRAEFGWDDLHRVIGFTGTFGGWHGIDVLAAALPRICAAAPEARFLLIGDGNYKSLIDDAIKAHGLQGQVHCTGRVEQVEGRRLLGACDLFVSPHNRHMVGSRFFGSPTKIFEYMAMAAGIVSSDLEQIGQVLSPALRPHDFTPSGPRPVVTNQRAVLCKPGDVEEFVRGVLALVRDPATCAALGRNARQAILDHHSWDRHVERLWQFGLERRQASARCLMALSSQAANDVPAGNGASYRLQTGDADKDEVQNQWDENPCGSHYVKKAAPHTLEWFLEAEAYRYGSYAPWMPTVMEFDRFAGKDVLEIGGGMGTDLAQFARHGARVTDLDLSAGHLALAQENFRLRGLSGRFIHHDAEELPFPDESFDLVYSNGVIHHTPNTHRVVREMYRVLRPGGRAFVMVYAENGLHYWRNLVWEIGLNGGELEHGSMGALMSRHVEITENGARPLVKVYTRRRLRRLFKDFRHVRILKRQLTAPELPRLLRWMPLGLAGRLMGWNLIVKATKG
jgi:glycosyltransferase involved in cell wall biosynthesis/ubiquinone/menaquinone biosynthesis C-methylase UbiE